MPGRALLSLAVILLSQLDLNAQTEAKWKKDYIYLSGQLAAEVIPDRAPRRSISFVGVEQASATQATSITIRRPAGTQESDLLVAILYGSPSSLDISFRSPSGWVLVQNIAGSPGQVFRKVLTSSEPSSYTFTANATLTIVGVISAYRGVESGAQGTNFFPFPLPVDANSSSFASGTVFRTPSVNTATPRTYNLIYFAVRKVVTFAPLSPSYTVRAQVNASNGAGNDATLMVADGEVQLEPGPTGQKEASVSESSNGSAGIVALMASGHLFRRNRTAAVTSSSGATSISLSSLGPRPNELVLVHLVATGGSSLAITPPAGFRLLRRIDNGTDLVQAYYYKLATVESAHYVFTFSSTERAVAALSLYFGVDTSNPIQVENGQATPGGKSHAAPSVSPTRSDTLVVGLFGVKIADTFNSWSPPSGMQEEIDSSVTSSLGGVSIEVAQGYKGTASATGDKTAGSSVSGPGTAALVVISPKP